MMCYCMKNENNNDKKENNNTKLKINTLSDLHSLLHNNNNNNSKLSPLQFYWTDCYPLLI
jgi:hypothetical protein